MKAKITVEEEVPIIAEKFWQRYQDHNGCSTCFFADAVRYGMDGMCTYPGRLSKDDMDRCQQQRKDIP